MGQNRNLVALLGLPQHAECPACKHEVYLWFDDFDLDARRFFGNAEPGVFEIEDIACSSCSAKIHVRCQLDVRTAVILVKPKT